MGKLIFVTGTDTGVGKTVVTALAVRHFRHSGLKSLAIKPFCSGTLADARMLHDAQEGELSVDEISPFHFPEPLAPGVQPWRGRGRRPGLAQAMEKIAKLQARCDLLLVEGCGGLRVPLGPGFEISDLVVALKSPVLLVAANRLGGISQTLLSLEHLERVNPGKTSVILSGTSAGEARLKRTNASYLVGKIRPTPLISLEFLHDWDGSVSGMKNCGKKTKKVLARVGVPA